MAHGYKLVGKAARFGSDYTPSLIGVGPDQEEPSADDLYYERFEFDLAAGSIASVARTKWVSYDSLPGDARDPILAVKGRGVEFYITASELLEIANEIGDDDLAALVKVKAR